MERDGRAPGGDWIAASRPLSREEIQGLQEGGNVCTPPSPNWENVRVMMPVEDSGSSSSSSNSSSSSSRHFDAAFVRGCTFGGMCILGHFGGTPHSVGGTVQLPSGIYNSTVVDSVVCENARVSDTTLLARTFVGSQAAVLGCGIVTMSARRSSFANGRRISVAVETGGREFALHAEATIEEAAKVVGDRADTAAVDAWERRAAAFAEAISSEKNIICAGAKLLSCPRVENAYIGVGARIQASTVINSTILSNAATAGGEEPTVVEGGCLIEHSIVQQACHCASMAIVSNSLMCTTSSVERHAKVLQSVLGPCSGAAEGEISSSLVGPFVGFHHQALLIACFWPAGRGNVGYGANVGSNHTGKAPDQEIWPGEGCFFGLATSIKYPSDFTHAPYTLVATGVKTLPQRLEMPFSLINIPGEGVPGISPALNEVMPGWILSDNLYMVLRGETKFQARGAAARAKLSQPSTGGAKLDFDYEALRPQTVGFMKTARSRLEAAAALVAATANTSANGRGKPPVHRDQNGSPVYTDRHIPGLGKNYITELSRKRAVAAYSHFITFYALRALWRALQSGESVRDIMFKPCCECCGRMDPGAQCRCDSSCSRCCCSQTCRFDPLATATRCSRLSPSEEWYTYARPIALAELEREQCERVGMKTGDTTGRSAPRSFDLKNALLRLVQLQKDAAKSVLTSKQKDDKRGPKIIKEFYRAAHAPAQDCDVVVAAALRDAQRLEDEVTLFLRRNQKVHENPQSEKATLAKL